MKVNQLVARLSLCSFAVLLSACGGRSEEAGIPVNGGTSTLSVSPQDVTFTAPAGTAAGTCLGGGSATFFIYGGTAPYRIDNPYPLYLSVDRNSIGDKGGSFTVTTLGPCLSPGGVIVIDKLEQRIEVSITNAPAG